MSNKSKVAFLTFSLISIPYLCLAQQDNATQTNTSQETTVSAPAVAPVPAAQESKNVTGIEVKGNKSISTNTIISKMKTRIGNPYLENVISDDLKRLYLLGFFADIKIDTEDYKDGLKVIVTVVERPMIEKITFSGIVKITEKDEKIKEQLKSKEGQYLDYPNLTEDEHILEKKYEKIGYNQVKIDYQVETNKENGKVKINFNVSEGKKVRIKDIVITGNKSFSRGRILKLIKTRYAWFFNAGLLKEDVLKEDMDRIKAFYQRQGYTDVAVQYTVSADQKRPYLLFVNITIEEGKKYLVGNITVRGNKDIAEKDILPRITECVPGKVYSQEALKKDVADIQGLYFDHGYITCHVQDSTTVNTYTGRVDVTYDITENQIAYVDKIKLRGNVKTRDVVVRRELRIKPGDRFDGDKLRRSKERLQNLGFFEDVSYDTEDTDVPDKKNLIVDVKESKTGAFSFGGGYSTVDQLVGFVEVEQKNFDWKSWPYFTGGGQDLKIRASFGSLSRDNELSFTEPWVFDYPVSFGFDAYQRSHKRDEDVGYGYDEKTSGGDLHLGRELTEYLRGDIMYRDDVIKITNITENASTDLQNEYGTNTISSIIPSLTFDSRDNVNDPTKGNLITGSFEFAGSYLGGTKDFWKFYGRASHYFPLINKSSLEIRGRLGMSKPYGDSNEIPIYERFFAGGAYTVRGYDERKIGPFDPDSKDPLGGQAMVVGNIEYTYPIFSFLKGALFFDTGNVWEKLNQLSTKEYKSGFGFGVRINTPIGPIMVDYGIPLNKASGEEKKTGGKFTFSASHGF